MTDQHQESGEGRGVVSGFDPAALEPFFGYYASRNVLARVPNVREKLRGWTPEIMLDEDRLPKAELVRTEYYNDFLKPLGVHSVAMIGLALRDLNGVVLNLTRPASRDQFGADEMAYLRRVHPHLIRAYALTVKLAGLRQIATDATAAMDSSPFGLVLTEGDGRIRHMNRLAEALTGGRDGLHVLGGRLTAARSEEARRLEALIGAAASPDPRSRAGGSMAVHAAGRRLPLSLTVAPLRSERATMFDVALSAIVCISDLEAGTRLPEQRLVELFALTPAEARVALALLEGGGPRDAARNLGISFYTARAHLARIFEKTGTSRQSELVRLMMRAIGVDFA
jgi:DNA-binding CsgD family transcriptional regulator